MRIHGTFSTASRTRLVGTWTFPSYFRFTFKADGSRTRLTGWHWDHGDGWKLVLASGTRIVGQFRRTA